MFLLTSDNGADDAEKGSNMEKLMENEEIDVDLKDPATADAAVKIQAVFRGHKSRQEDQKKKEEESAATKIQAGFRGHQVRKSNNEMKSSTANNDKEDTEETEYVKSVIVNENAAENEADKESKYEEAATKIQAGFRGYKTREGLKEGTSEIAVDQGEQDTAKADEDTKDANDDAADPNEVDAAVKIQASFRGHQARKEVDAMKSTQNEDDTATAGKIANLMIA